MSEKIDKKLNEMRTYIHKRNWILLEAIFDYSGSCDGLFNLPEKLKGIDIILIYDTSDLLDDFSLDFLFQLARSENIEIIRFITGSERNDK